MSYYKKLNKVYSAQFHRPPEFWNKRSIPKGQILYHKKNFSKYFALPIKNFKNKKVLETGAGGGIHAVILALMYAEVHAADILNSNVSKIRKLKKIYKLNNLIVSQHDFRNDYNKEKFFDLISCHNWIQHSPNPGFILKKLIKKMKVGGRLYISTYQAGTFRFFINQLARAVLKFDDVKKLKKRTPKFFPIGFKVYKNPLFISYNIMRDDFFTPYCVSTNYSELLKLTKSCNLKPITKIPQIKKLIYKDDVPMRMGFVKTSKENKFGKSKYFSAPIDEFRKSSCKIKNECIKLSKKIIIDFKRKSSSSDRINLCLNLYKIRSKYSRSSTNEKYKELKNLLANLKIKKI